MKLMRINFSHATYEEADLRTSNLRKYATNKGAHQDLNSIMLDTQGPEIRTGSFKEVKEGIINPLSIICKSFYTNTISCR